MDKTITQFRRLTPENTVEQITWFKKLDGSKYSIKEPVKVGTNELTVLKNSIHQEIFI
jgi:hypothetical protein